MYKKIKEYLLFCLSFLIIHFLLAFPYMYVATLKEGHGLFKVKVADFFYIGLLRGFYFNLEWLLILVLGGLFLKSKKIKIIYSALLVLLFTAIIAFLVYIYFYQFTYGVIPIIITDLPLLKNILPAYMSSLGIAMSMGSWLKLVCALVLFVGLLYLIYRLVLKQINFLQAHMHSYVLLLGLVGIILFYILNFNNNARKPIFSESKHIRMVLDGSRRDDLVVEIKSNKYKLFLNEKLKKKPNVYFIFIEAYGATAQLSEDTRAAFEILGKKIDRLYKKNGWLIASKYSESPVAGGKSWLAFSSVLSGLKLSAQDNYLKLLEYKDFPHVMDFFQHHDYYTTRMHNMKTTSEDIKALNDATNAFWHSDTVLLYPDFNYKGRLYNPYGGIPDQYALGFYEEKVKKKTNQSDFLFFITIGSHYPWFETVDLVDDWHSLDTTKRGGEFFDWNNLKGKNIDRYMTEIDYQLRNIEDFVDHNLDSNDIVLVIGDHQPATMDYEVPPYISTFCTPLHIITKNPTFHKAFINSGFEEGTFISDYKNNWIKHEDVYPLFIEKFVDTYGE